jgi:hypothetical protein
MYGFRVFIVIAKLGQASYPNRLQTQNRGWDFHLTQILSQMSKLKSKPLLAQY